MMTDIDLYPAIIEGSDALFKRLAARLKQGPGYDLLTVLAPNPDGKRLDRLYSTNHDQYPLGAADEVQDDVWFRQLFGKKQPIVANTMDEIGEWLPDYALFIDQNYFSLLNLPVLFAGKTIGLINMMGAAHHFDPVTLAKIDNELPLAALAILGWSEEHR